MLHEGELVDLDAGPILSDIDHIYAQTLYPKPVYPKPIKAARSLSTSATRKIDLKSVQVTGNQNEHSVVAAESAKENV